MVAAIEHRACRSPSNGSPITAVATLPAITRSFACDIGLEPRTTPIESPESNETAEAFVRTIKRDYARVSPRPNAETVMRPLPSLDPHTSPRRCRPLNWTPNLPSVFRYG